MEDEIVWLQRVLKAAEAHNDRDVKLLLNQRDCELEAAIRDHLATAKKLSFELFDTLSKLNELDDYTALEELVDQLCFAVDDAARVQDERAPPVLQD